MKTLMIRSIWLVGALVLAFPAVSFARQGAVKDFHQTQRVERQQHRVVQKAENKAFRETLDGKSQEERKAARQMHREEQQAEKKEFKEQQKQENVSFRESRRAEQDALLEKIKNDPKMTPEEKKAAIKAHRDKVRAEAKGPGSS